MPKLFVELVFMNKAKNTPFERGCKRSQDISKLTLNILNTEYVIGISGINYSVIVSPIRRYNLFTNYLNGPRIAVRVTLDYYVNYSQLEMLWICIRYAI